MIAGPLVTLFLEVYYITSAAAGEAILAETSTQETIQAKRNNQLSLRNGQWDRLLRDAGNVKRGLVLTALASPNSTNVGDTIKLRLYLTDVTKLPAVISFDRYGADVPFGLIRDQSGKPVRLSDEGLHRIERRPSKISGVSEVLLPGDAVGNTYPLSSDFVLDKPGKYTVLVAFQSLVARPFEFALQPRDGGVVGRGRVESQRPVLPAPRNVASRTDEHWDTLLRLAGTELNGCTLHGLLSPYSPNAVHLVVSITCVRDMNVRTSGLLYHSEGCTIKRGTAPWDYRIVIRDSNGGAVPMTSFGREFFRRPSGDHPCPIELNCSVGTWLPLDELFSFQSGKEYTVLAMISDNPGSMRALVSRPIKIRVPQLSLAGRNRPFFGSDEIWPRLVARSLIRDSILAIGCKLFHSNDPFDADGTPQITLRKRSGDGFGRELGSAETTVLVRDHRAKPVFPIKPSDSDPDRDQLHAGAAKREGAKNCLDTRDFQPLDPRIETPEGSKAIVTFPRFPELYPIIAGEPYTIVVAVRMRDIRGSFAVAGPLTYVPPANGRFHSSEATDSRCLFPDLAPDRAQLMQRDWDTLLRFAGKPFGHLLLTASKGDAGQLRVSLGNQGKQSIVVKKWEGIGGYDVILRSSDGQMVPLRERGFLKAVRPSTYTI